MSAYKFRNLPRDNDYSLEAMERDLLTPANLKFARDADGAILDVTNPRAGVEGSLRIEVSKPESYTPELLYAALDGAEAAEKRWMKTGQRELTIDERPKCDNIDFERAVILANLLDGDSLQLLSARGMHGKPTGNRMAKVDAVADLLYKASYGRDLYTNAPILGRAQDQGHLESNSRGGVRLRPELALVNQWLTDTEGAERLERIRQARIRMGAAKCFTPEMLNSPELANLMRYKDFQNMVEQQQIRKEVYGYT